MDNEAPGPDHPGGTGDHHDVTYMILYSHPLYIRPAPWLNVFERKRPYREMALERPKRPDGLDGDRFSAAGVEAGPSARIARSRLYRPGSGRGADPVHAQALEKAGVARLINPYNAAADQTGRGLAQELKRSS
ncbi:hypothetical protein [Stutzerimonas tarimensis]|uniref:Uncharacterized protein n=1 Tax=Stutzerimonas tarimensis TaxID=1507735 RepID=A0ABV7T504_9GAMM